MVVSRIFFAGVLLLVALLYLPVQDFQYVWDDFALFLDSAALRGGEDIWTAISQPILPGTTYFRPLVLLSFAMQFEWLGLNPEYAHLSNLFLHLLNVLLVGLLANALQAKDERPSVWRSIAAMTLYGLHPALIEPVAWASGRFDLLVTTFVLLGLYGGLKGGRSGVVVAVLSFFLAALCKEMAATFPLLLIMLVWAADAPNERKIGALRDLFVRRTAHVVLGVFLVGSGYLYLRHQAVSSLYHQDAGVAGVTDLWSHLALVGHTVAFYSRMVLWPFDNLGPMHPFDIANITVAEVKTGLGLVSIWLLLCAVALYFRGRVLLLLLAGWIALLPVLNLVPLTIGGNIGHERFLTLPLFFFAVAFSQLRIDSLNFSRAMRKCSPLILGWMLLAWLGFAALNIKVTLPVWANELALWGWAYEKNPESRYVQFNLISTAVKNNRLDVAGRILGEIEEVKNETPQEVRLLAIKGYYQQRAGSHEEALDSLGKALAGSDLPHLEVLNAGVDLEGASIEGKSFSESWFLRFAYGAMAEASISLRRYDDAFEYTKIARFYQRDYAPLYMLTALAMYGKGRAVAGDEWFEKAVGFYAPEAVPEARAIRENFLKQVCELPDHPDAVCGGRNSRT